MSRVRVYEAKNAGAVVAKVEAVFDAIRQRAYDIFLQRGCAAGGDLDDWLQAERDLFFVPHAEVMESEKSFRVSIPVPGFDPGDVEVMALPGELLVEAKTERRLEIKRDQMRAEVLDSRALHRRIDLTGPIETAKVTARIDEGTLTIEAPKRTVHRIMARSAAA